VLVIHPIVQLSALLLALYVLYLGIQRFRFLHLHHEIVFHWRQHVALGEIALGVLLAGMVGGIAIVYIFWHGLFMTGIHGKVALVMAPFIIFGLISGLYMNHKKRKRRILPFVHGLNNLVVLIMAISQIISGLWVYRNFVLGG
jgi:hypothetical protein